MNTAETRPQAVSGGGPAWVVAGQILWLCRNTPTTQFQLRKLIYIAHGWSFDLRDKPLILGRIYAWKYGSVILASSIDIKIVSVAAALWRRSANLPAECVQPLLTISELPCRILRKCIFTQHRAAFGLRSMLARSSVSLEYSRIFCTVFCERGRHTTHGKEPAGNARSIPAYL